MAKLLVTGGAGFIGSNLVDRLIKDGHEVVVLDNLSTGKRENLNPKAKFIKCDIGNYDGIASHFAGVEAVFHTAALARITPSMENPLAYNEANVDGTLNVLWAAKNAGAKKVVYSASSSAYGDQPPDAYPLTEDLIPRPVSSPYALQKYVGELYCRLFSGVYNLPTVMLRYFNVYGPRELTEGAYAAVIGIFLKQRQEGKPMTIVGTGTRRRDYTHVSDVVEANLLAWQKDVPAGELFNVGFGKNYSVNELTDLIGGERINIADRPWEYEITLADNSRAKKLLGWEPKVSLEEGIAELKELHGL